MKKKFENIIIKGVNMIIISLEDCNGCMIFKQRHPELRVIEIPRSCEGDKTCQNIKKILSKFDVKEFPVVMNDGLTQVLDMERVDPEFAELQKD